MTLGFIGIALLVSAFLNALGFWNDKVLDLQQSKVALFTLRMSLFFWMAAFAFADLKLGGIL